MYFTNRCSVVKIINVREHEMRDFVSLLNPVHHLGPGRLFPWGDDFVRVQQGDPLVGVQVVVETRVVGLREGEM